MNRNQPTKESTLRPRGLDPLADRLRQEAIETWPRFSESLHQRVLEAVAERRAEMPPRSASSASRIRRPRGLVSLLTAACVLCAAVVGWRVYDGRIRAMRNAVIEQHVGDFVTQMVSHWPPTDWAGSDDAENGTASVGDLICSGGLSSQTDHLADDARSAADTLLRRLPIDMELAQSP
ncbi:MAG: hypothetical protein ABFC96_09735 [Thermoguttaceae bacterium]